jgi:hypothetical protein
VTPLVIGIIQPAQQLRAGLPFQTGAGVSPEQTELITTKAVSTFSGNSRPLACKVLSLILDLYLNFQTRLVISPDTNRGVETPFSYSHDLKKVLLKPAYFTQNFFNLSFNTFVP